MSTFSAANDAALAQPVVMMFGALSIALPGRTIYLLEGAGQVPFGGNTYLGDDPVFGSIMSMETLTDGTGDEAPAVRMTFAPKDDAAATTLAQPQMQGAAVSLWLGILNMTTGLPIDMPELQFSGSLDIVTLKGGTNSRTLDMEITSDDELFFFTDDGIRLSDTFHRHLWPGETGLADVTGILRQIYWGTSPESGVSR